MTGGWFMALFWVLTIWPIPILPKNRHIYKHPTCPGSWNGEWLKGNICTFHVDVCLDEKGASNGWGDPQNPQWMIILTAKYGWFGHLLPLWTGNLHISFGVTKIQTGFQSWKHPWAKFRVIQIGVGCWVDPNSHSIWTNHIQSQHHLPVCDDPFPSFIAYNYTCFRTGPPCRVSQTLDGNEPSIMIIMANCKAT